MQRGRIPVVLEASSLIRNEIEDEIPMVAGIEGPFDPTSSLCGSSSFLMWTINNPDTVKVVIEKCIDACIICAKAYLRSGANAVVMAEALSSPEMMGPDAFRQFVKPALIRFTKALPEINLSNFNCNYIIHYFLEQWNNSILGVAHEFLNSVFSSPHQRTSSLFHIHFDQDVQIF